MTRQNITAPKTNRRRNDRRELGRAPTAPKPSPQPRQLRIPSPRPLPEEHPLSQAMADLSQTRSRRREYWFRLARRLGPDWDLPDAPDRRKFEHEEALADQKSQDLAILAAFAQRNLPLSDTPLRRDRAPPDDGCTSVSKRLRIDDRYADGMSAEQAAKSKVRNWIEENSAKAHANRAPPVVGYMPDQEQSPRMKQKVRVRLPAPPISSPQGTWPDDHMRDHATGAEDDLLGLLTNHLNSEQGEEEPRAEHDVGLRGQNSLPATASWEAQNERETDARKSPVIKEELLF